MRLKILDEVDDAPVNPYRPSLADRLRMELADKKDLEDLLQALEDKKKDKDKDKKKKAGLSARETFYIMMGLSPWIYIITHHFLVQFK